MSNDQSSISDIQHKKKKKKETDFDMKYSP